MLGSVYLCTLLLAGPATPTDKALSRTEARIVTSRVWATWTARHRAQLSSELDRKLIAVDNYRLRLIERRFGEKPPAGHALFISLHGGRAGDEAANDEQWQTHSRLYRPLEGILVAPRAPGNAADMWHQAHVDRLLDRLIQAYVATGQVDPDRVYLLGYAAGADGVYRIAARMADRFAAAAAMAGHPHETKPDSLRNLPFSIWMGARDRVYDRNKLARAWKARLDALERADAGGYPHRVTIFPELGHWLNGQDQLALPWMHKRRRRTWPKKVVWRQDDVPHRRFYWLSVQSEEARAGDRIVASVKGQTIRVTVEAPKLSQLVLRLSDGLLDLERPVTVLVNEQRVFSGFVARKARAIQASLAERPDPRLAAAAELAVPLRGRAPVAQPDRASPPPAAPTTAH